MNPFALAPATNPSVAITADMLEPIIDSITGNLAVIIPVGITIMGILVGIALIPRILKKFTNT